MLQIEHSWFEQSGATKSPKPATKAKSGKPAGSAFLMILGIVVGTFIFISNYYVSPTQAAGVKTLPTAIEDFSRNLNEILN